MCKSNSDNGFFVHNSMPEQYITRLIYKILDSLPYLTLW